MNDSDTIPSPNPNPPISSSPGNAPQDTLLQRGAFDPPFTPGTLGRLDRFEILRLLGEGGMGQVYLAREPLTGVRVAIKIIRPQLANDPKEVHRFLTEARHMYGMSHPHILRVMEVSDRKEGPYYVMPYVEGGNLQTLCKPGQALPEDKLLPIAQQVAGALAYAHTRGIIHRDIKPFNVLLDKQGNAFLSDFGLVRTVFNDSMVDSSASHMEGTAHYMSPAVASGDAEDTRCDIYAFGAVLYELLTGQTPYTGRTPQIILDQVLKGPPPPIRTVNPKANPALVQIAEGCMARELRDRYATMGDVAADLDRAAKGATPLGTHQQKRGRWPGIAALAAGVLFVAVVVGAAAYRFLADDTEVVPPAEQAGSGTGLLEGRAPSRPSSEEGPSQPEAPADERDFSCVPGNDAVAIARYTGNGGVVTIPDKIAGLPVTAIRNEAFLNCTNLTSVTIPNSVTNIGNGAFKNCAKMAKITMGKSVTSIGYEAFSDCSNLTGVTIPAGVTSVNWGSTFSGCSRLSSVAVDILNPSFTSSRDGVVFNKEKTVLIWCPMGKAGDYAIPNGVTSINGFGGCLNLTGITIPDSVTSFGQAAFYGCPKLTRMKIPKSVSFYGYEQFVACTGLVSIEVDAASPYYCSKDGVVFNKGMTAIYRYPGGRVGSYDIPNGVNTIDGDAFRVCPFLRSVTIPESVTNIAGPAFEGCVSLETILFKGNAPGLNPSAFQGVTNATVYYRPGTKGWGKEFGGRPTAVWTDATATADASATAVNTTNTATETPAATDEHDFACTAANGAVTIVRYTGDGGAVVIPGMISGMPVTSIKNEAFQNCATLTGVTVPNSVTNIGVGVFRNCIGLTNLTIGNGVTMIRPDMWPNCTNLTKIVLGIGIVSIENEALSGLCKLTSVTIPNNVTNLGYRAFRDCVSLTNITLGSGLTSIPNEAFFNCRNLANATIPNNVTNIAYDAFRNCVGLTDVRLGNGVVNIQDETFVNCSNLAKVAIGTGVVGIGHRAFLSCSKLTSIAIPDNVTVIGWGTFAECGSLTNVAIGKGLINISEFAFGNCASLTTVTLGKGVTGIGWNAFAGCRNLVSILVDVLNPIYNSSADGVLFNKEKTVLLRYPPGRAGNYTIPSYVTGIGNRAFGECVRLTGVTIQNGVGWIDSSAFLSCSNLTSITLPASMGSVQANAFEFCSRLSSIMVDDANPLSSSVDGVMLSKDKTCLYRYPAGKTGDYVIPSTVMNISGGAFGASPGLTGVSIPEGVTTLADWTFVACANLTNVTIPSSVTSMGHNLFRDCTKLVNITIPNNVTIIGNGAFAGCTSLRNITIPNGVTSIGGEAFVGCGKLASVTIPGNVNSIGGSAFRSCGSLTNVTIADGVNVIAGEAFRDSTNLVNVTLPNSVTSIEDWTFAGCGKLASVTIPASVKSIGGGAFRSCSSLTDVVISTDVTSIGNEAFRDCTKLVNITIPNSVTTIGNRAFAGCTSLGNVTIPNSVSNIWHGAFNGCSNLTNVTLPEKVATIRGGWNGDGVFEDCSALTSVTIPTSVTNIERAAFWSCTSLTNVILPNGLTDIGPLAFHGCSKLTEVTIPNSVTEIGGAAFKGCASLTNVTISDNVVIIRGGWWNATFDGCTNLTHVTIPKGVITVEPFAFYGCSRLTAVTIGSGVTNICGGAFAGCFNLTDVYFQGNPPSSGYDFNGHKKELTVYYRPGTADWGREFSGRPTAVWVPEAQGMATNLVSKAFVVSEAEKKQDWDAALLEYETSYDSKGGDEFMRSTLRKKFAELRPKVQSNRDPAKAGVWKVKAYVFRELDFRWTDKEKKSHRSQWKMSDSEIGTIRTALGAFADRVWEYTAGSLRIDWALEVIDTPLAKLDGDGAFWPGPWACMPYLAKLQPGDADTVMVYAKVQGGKDEKGDAVPMAFPASTQGILNETKGATYIGFNMGGGTTGGEVPGETELHQWLNNVKWTLEERQVYPNRLMSSADGGRVEGELGGDYCYRRKKYENGWMGYYRHLMQEHVTRKMWRELSVRGTLGNVWFNQYAHRLTLLGPFPSDGKPDLGINEGFIDEANVDPKVGAKVGSLEWKTAVCEDGKVCWLGWRGVEVNYLAIWVESETEQVAKILVGLDDRCRVLLNGKIVLTAVLTGPFVLDQFAANVILVKGRNQFLIKVGNTGGPTGASFRLTGPDEGPLVGVKYIVE